MKSYKDVELFAKNAPTGSYAAGCPANHKYGDHGQAYGAMDANGRIVYCYECEVAQ